VSTEARLTVSSNAALRVRQKGKNRLCKHKNPVKHQLSYFFIKYENIFGAIWYGSLFISRISIKNLHWFGESLVNLYETDFLWMKRIDKYKKYAFQIANQCLSLHFIFAKTFPVSKWDLCGYVDVEKGWRIVYLFLYTVHEYKDRNKMDEQNCQHIQVYCTHHAS